VPTSLEDPPASQTFLILRRMGPALLMNTGARHHARRSSLDRARAGRHLRVDWEISRGHAGAWVARPKENCFQQGQRNIFWRRATASEPSRLLITDGTTNDISWSARRNRFLRFTLNDFRIPMNAPSGKLRRTADNLHPLLQGGTAHHNEWLRQLDAGRKVFRFPKRRANGTAKLVGPSANVAALFRLQPPSRRCNLTTGPMKCRAIPVPSRGLATKLFAPRLAAAGGIGFA